IASSTGRNCSSSTPIPASSLPPRTSITRQHATLSRPRPSTYAVQPSGRTSSQRSPVSSRTSRSAQSSGLSSGSILPLGRVQSSYAGRWMTAISVSPDRDLRTTTPPAALITLTSATSRIFVATVAPSSAETSALRGALLHSAVVSGGSLPAVTGNANTFCCFGTSLADPPYE